jgi:pimeloyl-ACP methyl ester carboxylesterase
MRAVTVLDEASGRQRTLTAPYILDATELGELLELGNIERLVGAESRADTGEPNALEGAADPSDQMGFTHCFANGVDPEKAGVLWAEQRPAGAAQFTEASGAPAWKTIPCWALIGTEDHVIPPALQEQMADRAGAEVTTVKAGHLSLITNPAEVTNVILTAVASSLPALATMS